MLARGDLAIEADIASDTAPLNGLVRGAAGGRPGHPVDARRHPRRASARSCNELAQTSGLGVVLDEEAPAGAAARSSAPATCSASTRSTSPTRASSSRSCRPRRPTPRSPRCAPTRSAHDAAVIGEIVAEPAGHRRAAHRRSAAPGSSTCSSATRCRGSADRLVAREEERHVLGDPRTGRRHRRRRAASRQGRRQRRPRARSASGCSPTKGSQVGDWVLVHVGFAMAKIDEAEAAADPRPGAARWAASYADEIDAFRLVRDRLTGRSHAGEDRP